MNEFKPTAQLPEGLHFKEGSGSSVCQLCTFWEVPNPIKGFFVGVIFCPIDGYKMGVDMPDGTCFGTHDLSKEEFENYVFETVMEAINMKENNS